jgi:hypothetical protein
MPRYKLAEEIKKQLRESSRATWDAIGADVEACISTTGQGRVTMGMMVDGVLDFIRTYGDLGQNKDAWEQLSLNQKRTLIREALKN